MEDILNSILNWLSTAGVKIVIALVVLWIAFRIINHVSKKIAKKLEKSGKMDKTLSRTFVSAGRVILKILVVLAMVGYLGFDTSGIAALIASLGVALGLAVNGALGNVAGGVLILSPARTEWMISSRWRATAARWKRSTSARRRS